MLNLCLLCLCGILSVTSVPYCHNIAYIVLRSVAALMFGELNLMMSSECQKFTAIWVMYTSMSVVLALNRTMVMTCLAHDVEKWLINQNS